MPALAKPHRVAVLVPELRLDGIDLAHGPEAALLLWMACIETCQRHASLAVYDAESTPITPRNMHFAPRHATVGATPTDAVFGPTRRDEVVWLELALSAHKPSVVRLHAIGRDGRRQSFDAIGKKLGEQIDQVLAAWLAARELSPLPRRFEAITVDDLIATMRVIGPSLVEGARVPPASMMSTLVVAASDDTEDDEGDDGGDDEEDDDDDDDEEGDGEGGDDDDEGDADAEDEGVAETSKPPARPSARGARLAATRLPTALRVPALRVLALALGEALDDLILAADPEQPQALLATMKTPDFALLRRAIASAPNWARPHAELARAAGGSSDAPGAPKALEAVAAAGLAVMGRPGNFRVLDAARDALDDSGCIDEGVRLMERAVALRGDQQAHLALVRALRDADRTGAYVAAALRASQLHGCPMDSFWYPDQIETDLWASEALHHAGRLDEAIALRANRLEGRDATWPRHTRILANWRKNPKFVAWAYAREGYFRGDEARAVEGFGRIEPGDAVDVAIFLDSLVACGREAEVPLAWAHHGLGRGHDDPVARLAAARGLLAAGEWRWGLEELWRVELTEPGRDAHTAIARAGLLLSCAPIEVAELALGDRVAIGAATLARRMARDVADFMPGAAKSGVVVRSLGRASNVEFDPAWLAGFAPTTRSRRALDALFAEHGALARDDDSLARGDRLVDRWLEVAFAEASEDDPGALAQAAAYAAAQALARYLAATTCAPTPVAGALRTVASEALELVRTHRDALSDRDARALLATLEPLLRRVDRWIGSAWLATVERCCGIDERAGGDVGSFAKDLPSVAARILGPEESAVLASSIARLVRERPEGWAGAVVAQAERLALHTGFVGVDEWADALVARAGDLDDTIDGLHTACYLAEGCSAQPSLHAARALLRAGRAPAALAVLTAGLGGGTKRERDAGLASLADDWKKAGVDVPLAFDKVATAMFEALQKGNPARAEKLGRFAIACDPDNAEAHRNLGLALAQQGKVADAMHHLVRATPEQATQILSGVLAQAGKLPEAMVVLDYASRWYVRADQWLTYGGVAYNAMDNPRTVKAYQLALRLDPDAVDASQLNAYAGVLDEVGDYATCEAIADRLLAAAGDDLMWKTNAWNHRACALIGLGKFAEAIELAERAVAQNPLPDNTAPFATTLERAKTKTQTTPTPPAPPLAIDAGFALLAAGEHAAAAAGLDDPSWRIRRAALAASRFRFTSENDVAVTPRARAAASAILAGTRGSLDVDAMLCRSLALLVREQAYFARDPVPRLGDRMTRDAFYREFRARGGVVLGDDAPKPLAFVDRVVVPGGKVARASDYIALLRDLAALTPREALAQFDLDADDYVEVAQAWTAAMDRDPSLAATIAAGLTVA